MPVGCLLPTWPTPRDSGSALRFSPMPRTSSKTCLSPRTGLSWMAWPRTGATLTPLFRDAASWTACPTERGHLIAWKKTQWRRPDIMVRGYKLDYFFSESDKSLQTYYAKAWFSHCSKKYVTHFPNHFRGRIVFKNLNLPDYNTANIFPPSLLHVFFYPAIRIAKRERATRWCWRGSDGQHEHAVGSDCNLRWAGTLCIWAEWVCTSAGAGSHGSVWGPGSTAEIKLCI